MFDTLIMIAGIFKYYNLPLLFYILQWLLFSIWIRIVCTLNTYYPNLLTVIIISSTLQTSLKSLIESPQRLITIKKKTSYHHTTRLITWEWHKVTSPWTYKVKAYIEDVISCTKTTNSIELYISMRYLWKHIIRKSMSYRFKTSIDQKV